MHTVGCISSVQQEPRFDPQHYKLNKEGWRCSFSKNSLSFVSQHPHKQGAMLQAWNSNFGKQRQEDIWAY